MPTPYEEYKAALARMQVIPGAATPGGYGAPIGMGLPPEMPAPSASPLPAVIGLGGAAAASRAIPGLVKGLMAGTQAASAPAVAAPEILAATRLGASALPTFAGGVPGASSGMLEALQAAQMGPTIAGAPAAAPGLGLSPTMAAALPLAFMATAPITAPLIGKVGNSVAHALFGKPYDRPFDLKEAAASKRFNWQLPGAAGLDQKARESLMQRLRDANVLTAGKAIMNGDVESPTSQWRINERFIDPAKRAADIRAMQSAGSMQRTSDSYMPMRIAAAMKKGDTEYANELIGTQSILDKLRSTPLSAVHERLRPFVPELLALGEASKAATGITSAPPSLLKSGPLQSGMYVGAPTEFTDRMFRYPAGQGPQAPANAPRIEIKLPPRSKTVSPGIPKRK